MNEEQIRNIIREELKSLIKTERYTFNKLIQILDERNIQVGKTIGTKVGTETTQKLGFWNATPVVQQSSTDETSGFVENSGTTVNSSSTFTGNIGSTAYRISDIVKHLKTVGIIKS